ncbi:MAG: hypothetical protein ACRDT0_11485 [Pseudonocardiaceae bacterium]
MSGCDFEWLRVLVPQLAGVVVGRVERLAGRLRITAWPRRGRRR